MNGARVGITAGRRAEEQAALVRSLGGVPVVGSVLAAAPGPPGLCVSHALARVLDDPPDAAAFMTGVGTRLLFDAAVRVGLDSALREALGPARVYARGTKPRAALREQGIVPAMVADPPVSEVVVAAIIRDGVRHRRVFVQSDGSGDGTVVRDLTAAGAQVVEVRPYRSAPPDSRRQAESLIRCAAAGELDAITFTSAQAVQSFARIAGDSGIGIRALVADGVLVASVGPVTTSALRGVGLVVHVEPAVPRMGAMYHALSRRLRELRVTLPVTAATPHATA